MPLAVTPSCPSRNALLLLGSSHDSVPGMKFGYSSFAYSSACSVCGLLIATLLCASTSLPPNAHTSHDVQLESPVALPSAKPIGVFFAFSACASLRKPGMSLGNCSMPAAFMYDLRITIALPAAPIMIATQRLPDIP